MVFGLFLKAVRIYMVEPPILTVERARAFVVGRTWDRDLVWFGALEWIRGFCVGGVVCRSLGGGLLGFYIENMSLF